MIMLSFGRLADKIFQTIGIRAKSKGYIYTTEECLQKAETASVFGEEKILTFRGLSPQELK